VELRRRQQRHAQQLTVTARELADFLVSIEAEEALVEQRLRDAAVREALARRAPDVVAPSANAVGPVFPEMVCIEQGSTAPAAGESPESGRGGEAQALVIYGDY